MAAERRARREEIAKEKAEKARKAALDIRAGRGRPVESLPEAQQLAVADQNVQVHDAFRASPAHLGRGRFGGPAKKKKKKKKPEDEHRAGFEIVHERRPS